MRVLFITNYYPPCQYGWGYMQLCEEVADGLVHRGHEVAVLTSTELHGVEMERPYPVHRLLTIEPDWENGAFAPAQFFVGRRRREETAVAHLHQVIHDFRPDVAFVWHAIGIPRVLMQEAERQLNGRVAYYLADYQPEIADEYMNYWQGTPGNPLVKLLKSPISNYALNTLMKEGKPISLSYEHVACVSGYVRDRLVAQQLISSNAVVIHNGVDLTHFDVALRDKSPRSDKVRCIVAGRLVAEKGIHTVTDAFGQLDETLLQKVSLTILGGGPDDYVQMLHDKVEGYGLTAVVKFHASIPRDEMPQMLASHDVFLFSSEYDEPLARAMQEAMALGMLVIGTTTGGSGELLVNKETGLVYAAGNPQKLAQQLELALTDEALFRRLAQTGYETICNQFSILHTVQHTEKFLASILAVAGSA